MKLTIIISSIVVM